MFFLKMIYEIFIEDITNNIAAKFGSSWQGSFRGEEFYSFNQSESRSAHQTQFLLDQDEMEEFFRSASYKHYFCKAWFQLALLFQRTW